MNQLHNDIREMRFNPASVWNLIKLSNSDHENEINDGVVLSNLTQCHYPTIGMKPTFLASNNKWYRTSKVEEIISENEREIVFKTTDSIYCVKRIETSTIVRV